MRRLKLAVVLPVMWLSLFWANAANQYSEQRRYLHRSKYFEIGGCSALKKARADWPMCGEEPCMEWRDSPNGFCCWPSPIYKISYALNFVPSLTLIPVMTVTEARGWSQVWPYFILFPSLMWLQWWWIGGWCDRRIERWRKRREVH